MNDGLELAVIQPADQLAGRHDVGELALAEIAPLAGIPERVVDDNISTSGLVQAGDQIGTDEAGSACDQQHCSPAAIIGFPLPQCIRTCNVTAQKA